MVLGVCEESQRSNALSMVCNKSTMVFTAVFSSGDKGEVWRGDRQSAMSGRAWCRGGLDDVWEAVVLWWGYSKGGSNSECKSSREGDGKFNDLVRWARATEFVAVRATASAAASAAGKCDGQVQWASVMGDCDGQG